ncbi:MAG: 2-C-methyl-D-erythritol 4-phosphate cytidylyltransferase [Roseitalea sp.]|jgi:2-C-methyl-D-erythritol 4-phosphate cytidylyltransferase|nr:2-C-methyl-D-erythritol 4-phosphate cytidylyltransferase [Roseitalea sp.]MBO6720347.1 2-C-methyl-D-erythritol 4-phosphate cytidylyltransferase [Roseitalea sp.]MBO6742707.1 2-C-methyl-D-erythritol 4-phosphate cytidylyltransferase [Roseitalea sp.]
MSSVGIVIVAAGRGRRLGAETPKQYIELAGACSLRRVAETFLGLERIGFIVPVIHPGDVDLCAEALAGFDDRRLMPAVEGGETRAQSVRRGLEALEPHGPDLVLIHDAARPFVPVSVVEGVIAALGFSDGALAALPVVDALWREEGGEAADAVARTGLWRAQTPQGFDFAKILAAHRAHDGTGADDVAVAREAGIAVRLVPGSEQNYKITTTDDLHRALADVHDVDVGKAAAPDRDETVIVLPTGRSQLS